MKLIKTEWYPATINPVRDGWYEMKGAFVEKPNGGIVLRKWAGECWWWCRATCFCLLTQK